MSETFKAKWLIDKPEDFPAAGKMFVFSPWFVADIPVRFFWLLAHPPSGSPASAYYFDGEDA